MRGFPKGSEANRFAARQKYSEADYENPSGLGGLITKPNSLSHARLLRKGHQVYRASGIQPEGPQNPSGFRRLIITSLSISDARPPNVDKASRSAAR